MYLYIQQKKELILYYIRYQSFNTSAVHGFPSVIRNSTTAIDIIWVIIYCLIKTPIYFRLAVHNFTLVKIYAMSCTIISIGKNFPF